MVKAERKIPELRFLEFEGEWKTKRLGELCSTFKSGFGITSTDISEEGAYPVYGGNGLRGYTGRFTHEGFHVLIGRQGALCGNINRVIGKSYISEHAIAVQANEIADTEWLAQKLDFLNLNRLSESSAQPGLAVNKLVRLKLIVPERKEQQKLATFLTAVDDKIQQLTRKKALMEDYKKGVMQQIFSQQIRFKADDGSEFPEWEEKRLGDVFKEVKENVGSRDIETYSISAGLGFVSQKEKFGKDISGQQNEKYTVVQPNQFSYNKGNSKTYKFGCIYPNTLSTAIAVPNVFISFKLKNQQLSTTYFAKLFEHHYLDRGLRRIISSSARMDGLLNVNKKYFFELRVPVPSSPEQQKIANFLSALDIKINQVNTQLEQTKTFKKGLLQKMFV